VSTVGEVLDELLDVLDELLDELDELPVEGGWAELPPPPPPPAPVAAVGGIVGVLFARVFLTGSVESDMLVLNSV